MAKILVIEDAEYLAQGIARILQLEGHEVLIATTGRQGIEVALEQKPELILCDLAMPEVDGIGVLQAIRHEEELASVPFIFLTARAGQVDARMGLQAGADDYLTKPVTGKALLDTVQRHLERTTSLQVEYKQRLSELEQSLTYALPHEFRTALNGILGAATHLQVFADKLTPIELRELGEDIRVSARRLLRLTENFLMYARTDFLANSPELVEQLRQFVTEEPSIILQDISLMKAEEYGRTPDLRFSLTALNLHLAMPTDHFAKIAEELIDNALKFSPAGSPIALRTWCADGFFWIEIRDWGPGIPPDLPQRIRAYYQPGRILHEQQGVGLGLILAKRLVELYGGSFNIGSPGDGGTRVLYRLPLPHNQWTREDSNL
ncbi:MAG: response regulator [Candidatus Kapabacteria bacterium]|nr:response regulator [Candidatus Kapabacteria bacterium]MCS7169113.1 response regulator [Candidatus Kapabacteria bacterium]MDW8225867.1 response regulator [Bacteroidota bacterium]